MRSVNPVLYFVLQTFANMMIVDYDNSINF